MQALICVTFCVKYSVKLGPSLFLVPVSGVTLVISLVLLNDYIELVLTPVLKEVRAPWTLIGILEMSRSVFHRCLVG